VALGALPAAQAISEVSIMAWSQQGRALELLIEAAFRQASVQGQENLNAGLGGRLRVKDVIGDLLSMAESDEEAATGSTMCTSDAGSRRDNASRFPNSGSSSDGIGEATEPEPESEIVEKGKRSRRGRQLDNPEEFPVSLPAGLLEDDEEQGAGNDANASRSLGNEALWGLSTEDVAWMAMLMVVVKGIPKTYTQGMLLEEIWEAGFQVGRDYCDLFVPLDTNTGHSCGTCYISFSNTSAKAMFMRTFDSKPLRHFPGPARYTVMPATAEDLAQILSHQAAMQQLEQELEQMHNIQGMLQAASAVTDQRFGAAHHAFPAPELQHTISAQVEQAPAERSKACNFCPFCGCRAGGAFNFCTQCGSCLRDVLAPEPAIPEPAHVLAAPFPAAMLPKQKKPHGTNKVMRRPGL